MMKYIEMMLWWKSREWKKRLKFSQIYKQKKILMQMWGKKKWRKIWEIASSRKKWRHDSRNALCWLFYYVNDNKLVDVKCSQLMRCIICYVSPISITNAKTQIRKALILYSSANGIIAL
jgi:hypothetical protein